MMSTQTLELSSSFKAYGLSPTMMTSFCPHFKWEQDSFADDNCTNQCVRFFSF